MLVPNLFSQNDQDWAHFKGTPFQCNYLRKRDYSSEACSPNSCTDMLSVSFAPCPPSSFHEVWQRMCSFPLPLPGFPSLCTVTPPPPAPIPTPSHTASYDFFPVTFGPVTFLLWLFFLWLLGLSPLTMFCPWFTEKYLSNVCSADQLSVHLAW